MNAAQGILTARGGMTSHAAVVARGMGKCCVAGCGALSVDYERAAVLVRPRAARSCVKQGDVITLDGAHGRGDPRRGADGRAARSTSDFAHADEVGRRGARACGSAPTPTRRPTRRPRATSAPRASACAAPSTCSSSRATILAVREMILADNAERAAARARQDPADAARRLRRHLPRDGRAAGHDPPARSAAARVPAAREQAQIEEVARELGVTVDAVRARSAASCTRRTRCSATAAAGSAITYPEIYEMQVRAIVEAALRGRRRDGVDVRAGDHDPARRPRARARAACAALVETRRRRWSLERRARRDRVHGRHDDRAAARLRWSPIEIAGVRRVLLVRHQRPHADDVRPLARRRRRASCGDYVEHGIFPNDPFVAIDREGVGALIKHRRRAGPLGASPTSRSASAASTAASRRRSSSATASGSTT